MNFKGTCIGGPSAGIIVESDSYYISAMKPEPMESISVSEYVPVLAPYKVTLYQQKMWRTEEGEVVNFWVTREFVDSTALLKELVRFYESRHNLKILAIKDAQRALNDATINWDSTSAEQLYRDGYVIVKKEDLK